MKYRRTSRFLSIVLLVAMVLTLMPTAAFAEDSAVTESWELIGGADAIDAAAAEGTVAVTMTTENGTTYVLYNANGTESAPTGVIAEISDGKLSLGDVPSGRVTWNIEAEDGGYTIYSAADSGTWLYSTNANNGVRVGTNTAKTWVVDSNYLKHDGTGRFLGVYTNNPDWRAYTSINTNITGQTLQFWKLVTEEGGGTIDPPEPTEPPEEPEEPTESTNLVKFAEAPVDGDKVVIFYPADNQVLTAEANGKKLAGTAATPAEGKLALTDAMAYLTVSVTEEAYRFELEGKYLTSAETGNGLSFAEDGSSDLAKWKLEQQTDGTWYLMNVGANYNGNYNQALEYYNGFTTYGVKTDNAAYKFEFYGEEKTVDTVNLPKLTAAPADGAQVVIHYPAGNMALTAEANGKKLNGEAATPENGILVRTETMAFLTVHAADGEYSFELEGKYLTSAETGNGLSFAEDGASDLAKWTLEQQTDGTWYLMNVGANYNGNYNQALEYYNGFTTYGVKTDNAAYKFEFYGIGGTAPVEPDEPDTPEEPTESTTLVKFAEAPVDGDKVVIFYPAENQVLTAAASGKKLAGTAATPAEGKLALTDAMAYLTVSVTEDVYRFELEGKYLTSAETGNGLSFAEDGASDLAKWTLEQQTDGTWYLMNVGANYNGNYNQALEYYSGFTTYGVKADNAAYKFEFYGEEKTVDTVNLPKLTAAPADGAQVVIHYPAGNMALTATANGKKLDGEAVTPENGILVRTETMAFMTVHAADGVYSFELEGKYLTSAETGNGLSFAEDGASDLAKWTLEQQADGTWYLMNVGANYNGNYNQALEYYSGFTTYGVKADNAAYKFDFYGIGGTAPVEPDEPSGNTYGLASTLADGDTVILYNAGNKMALGNSLSNYKVTGVSVEPVNGVITTDNEAVAWKVTVNSDGTYTFTQGELTLGGSTRVSGDKTYNNITLNGPTATKWTLTGPDAEDFNYYMFLGEMETSFGNVYLEYYSGFTLYGQTADRVDKTAFGITFYKQGAAPEVPADQPGEGEPADGQQVVIYCAAAEGVLGLPNDMGNSFQLAPATVENDAAVVSNGALVFTVTREGEDYTFETGGKYLATSDAEDLFLQDTQDGYTKWYLTKNGDGFLIYNRTAKYNGNPVCIEFFSGSFSGWTFKSSDAAIFRFNFYPVAEGTAVVNGVAQVPSVNFDCEDTRYVGQDYEVKFTLDDLAPEIADISVTYTIGDVTEQVQEMSFADKTGSFTLPAAVLDASGIIKSFTVTVSVKNSYDLSYAGVKTVTVADEPYIGKLTPAPNAQTLEDKRPVISAEIGNVGENAVFTMTVNDEPVDAVYADGVLRFQAAEDMADGRYTVIITAVRADGKTVEKMWSFFVGEAQLQLFFGQLHSHTTYSDGSGTLDAALDYISKIPESGNIQFVAFTDHSNYFDSTSAANPEEALYDVSKMTDASRVTWDTYKQTVANFNASQGALVAIAGFEMTWSGGPGHINTFNSPGLVSRNNTTLNNKTNDAGMKAYYALLGNEALSGALSQFNHPGKTFGNFTDFSYWDAVTDSRIYLVEVGNGEGQIGAGGYYPSYEQYIMALDKGWHVGPTNNQDNHKGRWGNANDARDVILTDNFSEQGIYDAIKLYRIYATEDKNLEIQYTVNDEPLGTIFSEIPEELAFSVSVYDPDDSDSITKVELVANSGKVAYTWDDPNEIKTGLLEVTLDPAYNYYFVRVTQADGDLAVTAPVWVGESLKLGISAVECGTSTPVTGEEFTLSTTFYNSEATAATVKSIVYTVNGSEVIGTDSEQHSIPASSTATVDFKYTPAVAKIMTITVTAIVEMDGEEYTFTKDIELQVKDADKLVYIGIDASHYNEYVAGNYKDSMGNFGALAAGYGVRTVELKTSEELIAACSNEKYVAIIFTAPSRRLAAAQSDPRTYSAEEIAAITAFNQAGGQVIVCGWADNYENYPVITGNPEVKHMAQTQNELLAALGSSIRLGDDEAVDDVLNGGQSQRLYLDAFNFDSYLMQDVIVDPEHPNDRNYSEVYSNYGGCSVFFEGEGVPATVTPIVYGHSSTYTKDCDGDGLNEQIYPYGDGQRVVLMASEQLTDKGLIIVAGAAFMSNFEVQAAASSGSSDADMQKNYANYKICENLVKGFNEINVTPIAEVQKQTEIGLVYTIEGTVTSNASGYDKDTAFFDCIYIQDETAGICCFPVSGNYKIGDRVRITGYTDFYQAEMELQVMSIEVIGEGEPVQPIEVTAAQINDLSVLGSLVTLKGTVESFETENGLIQTILVKDAAGNIARVFIDGYITTAVDVMDLAVGCRIEATGLSSYDDTWKDSNYFPRIRVRDRADIICTPAADAAVVYGRTLLLQSKIGIRFYLDLPETLLADSAAYVSIDGVKFSVSSAPTSTISGKTYRSFTIFVKLTELTEKHLLRVFNGADEAVALLDREGADYTAEGYSYAAQQYIEAARGTGNEKLIKLVNALSDLGSLSQLYFKVDEENRAEVLADLSAVTLESVTDYAPQVNVKDGAGLSFIGSSLLLREDFTIRHYFKVTGDISQYTFMVDGKKVTPVQKGDYYFVPIKNIYSTDLSKNFHVEVSSAASGVIAEIDYCALSYAYKQLNTGEESDLTDLIRALVLYSREADSYFGG